MKLAGKLARKFREFFSSDFPFLNQIRQEIVAEMKAKSKRGRAGVYVPSYYWVSLPEDSFSTWDQELLQELEDSVEQTIERNDFKLYDELQFEFAACEAQEVKVNSKFKISEAEKKEKTKDNGTKVFSRQTQTENKNKSKVATIRMDSAVPKTAWLYLKQAEAEKKFSLNSVETNIGRQESNEITLVDRSVSRVHAQIIDKKYYYLIRDLNSTNGVLVNGEFVQQKQLTDGDKIKLGEMKLEFRQQKVNET